MEYQYDPEYCWHDNAVVVEGTDYDHIGTYRYYVFYCPDCGHRYDRGDEYI